MILTMTTRGRPSSKPRTAFGKRLAEARERVGITQAELGAKLGIGQRAVAHWERRPTAVLPEQLDFVAKLLKVTVDELVSGTNKRPVESGPQGKARRLFEQVSKLPRTQQLHILTVLEAFVEKKAAS